MNGAMAQAAAPQSGPAAATVEGSAGAGSNALGRGNLGDGRALLEQLIGQTAAPPQQNNQLPSVRAKAVNIVTSKPQMSRPQLQQPTKADKIQEGLEKTVSNETKEQINKIVNEVNELSDVEKLLLYLKLPSGSSGFGKDPTALQSGSRLEQVHAMTWIRSHLEEAAEICLPKQEVYEDYKHYCDNHGLKWLSQADFGKVMKSVYPDVKPRRLGQRGQSKHCYGGLKKKVVSDPPELPNIEVREETGIKLDEVCSNNAELDSAAGSLVCEWAQKLLNKNFPNLNDLAEHLVSNLYVNNRSMAAFTVVAASQKSSPSKIMSKSVLGFGGLGAPSSRHRETQIQLQRKIQEREHLREQKKKLEEQRVENTRRCSSSSEMDNFLIKSSTSNQISMSSSTTGCEFGQNKVASGNLQKIVPKLNITLAQSSSSTTNAKMAASATTTIVRSQGICTNKQQQLTSGNVSTVPIAAGIPSTPTQSVLILSPTPHSVPPPLLIVSPLRRSIQTVQKHPSTGVMDQSLINTMPIVTPGTNSQSLVNGSLKLQLSNTISSLGTKNSNNKSSTVVTCIPKSQFSSVAGNTSSYMTAAINQLAVKGSGSAFVPVGTVTTATANMQRDDKSQLSLTSNCDAVMTVNNNSDIKFNTGSNLPEKVFMINSESGVVSVQNTDGSRLTFAGVEEDSQSPVACLNSHPLAAAARDASLSGSQSPVKDKRTKGKSTPVKNKLTSKTVSSLLKEQRGYGPSSEQSLPFANDKRPVAEILRHYRQKHGTADCGSQESSQSPHKVIENLLLSGDVVPPGTMLSVSSTQATQIGQPLVHVRTMPVTATTDTVTQSSTAVKQMASIVRSCQSTANNGQSAAMMVAMTQKLELVKKESTVSNSRPLMTSMVSEASNNSSVTQATRSASSASTTGRSSAAKTVAELLSQADYRKRAMSDSKSENPYLKRQNLQNALKRSSSTDRHPDLTQILNSNDGESNNSSKASVMEKDVLLEYLCNDSVPENAELADITPSIAHIVSSRNQEGASYTDKPPFPQQNQVQRAGPNEPDFMSPPGIQRFIYPSQGAIGGPLLSQPILTRTNNNPLGLASSQDVFISGSSCSSSASISTSGESRPSLSSSRSIGPSPVYSMVASPHIDSLQQSPAAIMSSHGSCHSGSLQPSPSLSYYHDSAQPSPAAPEASPSSAGRSTPMSIMSPQMPGSMDINHAFMPIQGTAAEEQSLVSPVKPTAKHINILMMRAGVHGQFELNNLATEQSGAQLAVSQCSTDNVGSFLPYSSQSSLGGDDVCGITLNLKNPPSYRQSVALQQKVTGVGPRGNKNDGGQFLAPDSSNLRPLKRVGGKGSKGKEPPKKKKVPTATLR